MRDFLIRHPLSTFFFTLKQDYRRFELRVRDVLVVDRAACLSNGALVLGVRDGEFTLCLGRESEGTEIWGVVVAMMRRMQ